MTTTFSRWRYAAKPKSWPKLLVPMLLGQSLGAYLAGGMNPVAVVFGISFVVADLLYIVFLNDWADQEVDRIKRQMFPDGCSPKTIPDGILSSRSLLLAGLAAGTVGLFVAWLFGSWLGRPWLFAGASAALGVFWAYTLPPLRLNYRGGGELLEAAGVGFVLPWLNAYAQSGTVWAPVYGLLAPFVVLSLSSAVASGLADERSDVAGGKTTVASRFGNRFARRFVEGLMVLGVILWALSPLWLGLELTVPLWLGAGVTVAFVPRLFARTGQAGTDAFGAQGLYKLELHRAIWFGATAASLALVVTAHV